MDKEANAVRKEQWRRIVNDCINRDPQISKRRWCEENGIKFRSFTYWQNKFRKEALEQMDNSQATAPAVTAPALAPAFVDVTAKYEASKLLGLDDPGGSAALCAVSPRHQKSNCFKQSAEKSSRKS